MQSKPDLLWYKAPAGGSVLLVNPGLVLSINQQEAVKSFLSWGKGVRHYKMYW